MPSSLKKLLLILLLATDLVLLAVFGRTYPLRLEAEHWRRQLAAASDQDAVALIRAMPWDQGSQRLSLLVEALGSPRSCVHEAAAEMLRETIDRFHALDDRERLAHFADLAAALVEESHGFDSWACREAKALVEQILQRPYEGGPAERSRTIALCQRVLVALGDRDRVVSVDRLRQTAALPANPGSVAADWTTGHEPPPATTEVDSLLRLPGGAIPVESFALPPLPIFTPKAGVAADARNEPGPLTVPAQSQPLSPQPLGQAAVGAAPATSASANPWRQTAHHGNAMKATSLAEFRSRLGITPVVAVTGLEQSETLELMRDLNSTDPTIESKARTELTQRGFTDFHLKFARRLFDPDPAVRKEVAQMLPGLPGVDAVPWLLYLCRDDDPEVRLTAVSLIVTTGNPALLDKAEAIARADNDPRIQNQAEQIAQFRRQSASGGGFR
jgi:hypothetical protein